MSISCLEPRRQARTRRCHPATTPRGVQSRHACDLEQRRMLSTLFEFLMRANGCGCSSLQLLDVGFRCQKLLELYKDPLMCVPLTHCLDVIAQEFPVPLVHVVLQERLCVDEFARLGAIASPTPLVVLVDGCLRVCGGACTATSTETRRSSCFCTRFGACC